MLSGGHQATKKSSVFRQIYIFDVAPLSGPSLLVKTQECLDSDLLLLTSLTFQMKVEGSVETGVGG